MEGIIKAITVDPVKVTAGANPKASAAVKVYFNAAALAALIGSNGFDPADFNTTYITYNDGSINIQSMSLASAARYGLEISAYAELNAAVASD